MKEILNKCSNITMDKFIDCLCNQNYSCLVISGKYSELEISENWQNVFYEYCDLSNSTHYKSMLISFKNLGITEAKITAVNLCLVVLSYQYNQECVDILRKYGYDYDFNDADKESYLKDLEAVQTISKGALINLDAEKKNLERLMGNNNAKTKESDFDKTFIVLSKYMGYPVKKNITTVSEYCSMIKMINKK